MSAKEIDELRHAARMVVRELGLLADAYGDIGVTLAERHLLIELSECKSCTVNEMAERLLLDKSTASRLAFRAVKKGFVDCAVDAKDKRRRLLTLTEEGRHTLMSVERVAHKQVKEAMETLKADEAAMVLRGVGLFAKGLKQAREHD